MNPKLLLFLVLLCFPNQQVYLASGLPRFGGLGRIAGKFILKKALEYELCSLVHTYNSQYNCSSPLGAIYQTSDIDDSTMPDVSIGTFIISISVGVGASPQNVPLIVDTTLDYTYVLCQCDGGSCSTGSPVYDPSLSKRYTCVDPDCPSTQDSTVNCSNGYCTYNYTDIYVSSAGGLIKDTFQLSETESTPFIFGCGERNEGNYGASLGFLGLGAGNLSLVNQAGYDAFSYCISYSGDGVLFLGSSSGLLNSTGQSTYFLINPLVPRLHYVNFTGISIEGQEVDIPSKTYLPQPDLTGGMFLDTTIPISGLEESAYNAMKDEFVKKMSSYTQVNASPYGLDLCFALSPGEQPTIPQLTLHFDSGADFNPKDYLYFQPVNDNGTVGCLLIIPLKGVSILGLLMQLDTHMIYDITNGNLHFESANCSSLHV